MRIVEKQPLGSGELTIMALDERGSGGDNHVYAIGGAFIEANRARSGVGEEAGGALDALMDEGKLAAVIVFQDGSPASGVNGITIEALLAVCADRLQGCQSGPYACAENAAALHHLGEAMEALQARVRRIEGDTDSSRATTKATIKSLVNKLMTLTACMSYNESYCGEPAGRVKSDVMDWERRGGQPKLSDADRAAPIAQPDKPDSPTKGAAEAIMEAMLGDKLGGRVTVSAKTGNIIHHPADGSAAYRIDHAGQRVEGAPRCPACEGPDWRLDKVSHKHLCGDCGNDLPF